MQDKRLILILSLMLSMTAVSAWGAEEPVVDEEEGSTSLQPSNIEGWEEDESEQPSFFFGVGYEARNLGAPPQGGAPGGNEAGPATGGGSGGGKK